MAGEADRDWSQPWTCGCPSPGACNKSNRIDSSCRGCWPAYLFCCVTQAPCGLPASRMGMTPSSVCLRLPLPCALLPSPLSSETFIPSSAFPDPVHTMCVVGRNLWICTGGNTNAGTVVIYDLDTKAIKTKVRGREEGRGDGRWCQCCSHNAYSFAFFN